MTKLRIMSDLHLEFGGMEVPVLPHDSETILILAGDIHVGHGATEFLTPLLTRFQAIIYVLGNHEFYYEHMEEVRKWWQDTMKWHHNLHVLDPGTYEFNGIRIIGATLWTETQNPAMQNMLNDYAIIQREGRVLTVQDTYNLYLDDLEYIKATLLEPYAGTTVVVTHHAPIAACVRPHYVGDPMNPCFHSYLEDIIEDNDIELWVHGHMHDTVHTEYAGTKIICNPRGYVGHGMNWGFVTDEVTEV